MAITDMGGVGLRGEEDFVLPFLSGSAVRLWLGTDGFGFGTGNRDDEIVMAEVEVREIELAQDGENATESDREEIEPAGFDRSVLEPVDALFAVLGGVDRSVGIEVVEFEEDFFGTTFLG